MRDCPPLETRMRMQRMVPLVGSTYRQVPEVLVTSTCVIPAPCTRPNPVNTTVEPPATVILALLVPSVAERDWMSCGAAVSEGAALQAPVGFAWLTTHASDVVLRVQPEVRLLTNWKRTGELRRMASLRASCRPSSTEPAALRICVFCRK